MPQIQYAFRDDAKTIAMLTQGSTAACPLCQIVTLRKREIAPEFFDHYMVMDVKGTNFLVSSLTDYGRSLGQPTNHRKFLAIVDSQIEFTVKSSTMHKLTEFLPAYTGTALYNFFEGQPYGYLVVLRVYSISEEVPDALMLKGRMGGSQIISFYDRDGEKTYFEISETLKPIIDDGSFEYIKYEILHTLRVENALIGVYGTDEESRRLLKQKRDDHNDSTGQFKHEYNEEDNVDYSQVDYEETYSRVLEIDPSLEDFIKYVQDIKPPQMLECQAMLSRFASGDQQARCRIIEMYTRNVVRMALYYAEKYEIPLADAIQDGLTGLVTAVDKYKESDAETLQQYYPFWVRQVIQRELPAYLYKRYFPIYIHEKLLKIRELGEKFDLNLLEDNAVVDNSFIELVSQELEIPIDTACKYLQYFVPDIPLDMYLEKLEETIYPQDKNFTCDVVNDFLNSELRLLLDEMLDGLTSRENLTMRLRFGFIDGRTRTLEEVGREFNVTRERVRQIEAKCLRKLRHPKALKKVASFLN